jgi:hypothetical protein
MGVNRMRIVYLSATVLGAVAPYVFFVSYFLEPGDTSFVGQLFATAPAAGFATDLLITSAVFWIWSYAEAKRRGMTRWWVYVLVNLTIGLSCAFPLFLYVRERVTAAQQPLG